MKYLKPYRKQSNLCNESIKHLLKPKSEGDIKDNVHKLYPHKKLEQGAKYGLLWLVKMGLEEGAEIHEADDLAFRLSIKYSNMEITKYLVENGADVNADDGWALMAAVHSNDLYLVKYLVEKGAHIDENLLTIASENWYTEIYNYLQNKFNTNESIKHLLKPKSYDDILKSLENLSDLDKIKKIIKYNLPFSLLPENLIINGDLNFSNCQLIELPDNLTVNGGLYCRDNRIRKLPNKLIINGDFDISDNPISELPEDLIVNGHLFCRYTLVAKDIKKPEGVKGNLYI